MNVNTTAICKSQPIIYTLDHNPSSADQNYFVPATLWVRAMTLRNFFMANLQRKNDFYIGYQIFHQNSFK